MKRITQLLASILFIITVLTVYLGFDFAINSAMSTKYSSDKHHHHDGHVHDENIKLEKKSSALLQSSHIKKTNRTIKHDDEHDHIINYQRRTRSVKQKQLQAKPAQFHKSKTGVKINHVGKSVKERRKRLSTSTKFAPHKDAKIIIDMKHD